MKTLKSLIARTLFPQDRKDLLIPQWPRAILAGVLIRPFFLHHLFCVWSTAFFIIESLWRPQFLPNVSHSGFLGWRVMDWESINCLAYQSVSRPEVQTYVDCMSSKCQILLNQDSLLENIHWLADIALVSGCPIFLQAVLPLLPASLPVMIHCERCLCRDRLPDTFEIIWTRVSHARVGGVTNQHIWLGVWAIPSWFLAPRVARQIGHIISHSERRKPCQLVPTFPAPTEYAPEVFLPGACTIFDLERNADIRVDALRQRSTTLHGGIMIEVRLSFLEIEYQ